MWPIPLVNHAEDLQVEPDVGVVMLEMRQSVGSDIHLPGSMDYDEEDLWLVTHRPQIPSNAA